MIRAVVAAILLLAPLTSRAEGLLLGLSVGPGISVGRISWTGMSAPFGFPGEMMPEPRELTLTDVAAFGSVSVDARLGMAVSDQVLASLEGEVALLGGGATLGWTDYGVGYSVAGSAVATWRRPGQRIVLSAGAGLALTRFGGSRLDIGAENNIADFEDVIGPLAKVAVGWTLSPNSRAEFEARVNAQWSEHMVYVPVALNFRLRAGVL